MSNCSDETHQELMITVMDMVTSYVIVVYCNDTLFGTSAPRPHHSEAAQI